MLGTGSLYNGSSLVLGGKKITDVIFKGCAQADVCLEKSFNFGLSKMILRSKCCTGNLCNTQIPDYSSIPNGKKCFSCQASNCTVNCEGGEDYCITARVNVGGEIRIMKGCTSKGTCDTIVNEIRKEYGVEKISCCEGNYCNNDF
uniref:UPAR/Ly6 domain-containing protein n=1 Tax=Kryptolebias marmoratus TaxID=37003 RepID=A0A3Q3AMF9_KRYMA